MAANSDRARSDHEHEDRPALTVVVPAHNSADVIDDTVERLWQHLDGRRAEIIAGPWAEIVVVENGSTDDTAERCAHLASRAPGTCPVRVLSSPKGMGNALRAGIEASRGGVVVLTADDLPFGFDDLDAFDALAASPGGAPAVLIGSKAHPESRVDRDRLRRVLTRGFAMLRRIVLGMRTGDPQGTLIVDGALARELAPQLVEPGFLFTTELVYLAEQRGIRPVEVPVRLRGDHGAHGSRVSVGDVADMGAGLLRLRARHRGGQLPPRVA
ncbi:glycosyltransferase [Rhodococcus sp. HNM0569]|uniref:glycosyltransferase n=1 Tax=Rhodococcus sp. HNM0569 TaxID=2716340 RepID=UPI00146B907A|nr:glycosyltransferase [Rhodococcus sp. HNM0569]